MFEANLGQAEPGTLFLGRGPGYAIHFDRDGISLVRGKNIVRMNLQGAISPRISGNRPQEGRANYFIGNSDRWISDVPLYAGVQYSGVYPGVDLVFYSSEGELEYDFTLAPGASASTIKLAFGGIDEMRIDGGDLVLKTGWGELRHRRPRIYQMRNGRRSEIAGRFVIRGPKEAGFETDPYDVGSTLVIDPVMAYGTYIGGTGADSAWAVAVDSAGAAYVVGETWPVNFPKTFTISNSGGNGDAFIIKLNPSGTGVLYAAYFGGNARDSARGVAVDSAGNAYITGFTNSPDFPATAGAYRSPSLGQADAFAIKVNATGSALVYSALIGGGGSDSATGIAIDPSGSAYIAGYTSSVAFPVTSSGFQRTFGGGFQDAFVAKLNSSGSGLIYCTYLGGTANDVANGIAVDAAGQAYIAGYTDSANFPTRSAIYANAGGQGDAFVAKLTPAGDSLVFSTYLGGSLADIATAVALDSSGSVYVTGATLSANFPATGGAFQTLNQGSYDAFVTKMDSQGTRIVYSTYVGGEGSDQSSSIAVDFNGVAYIAGFTYSSHFPLQSPLVSAPRGGQEAFAAVVGPTGASLVWSTYLGGAADDQATGIAVDASGGVYVVGATFSGDFPTTSGAYRTAYAGGDGFVVKLALFQRPVNVSVTPSSGSGSSQVFSFVFSDPAGFEDLAWQQVIINSVLFPTGGCSIFYSPANNLVYFGNDAGALALGPQVLGTTGILQNSHCSLNVGASSVSGSGNNLTLRLAFSFQGGFAGTVEVWAVTGALNGLISGWQTMGTWTAVNPAPSVVSVSPASGNGTTQTFSLQYSDTGGATNLSSVWVWFTATGAQSNSCMMQFVRSVSTLYLINDAVTGWITATPGVAGTLQNSQCAINAGNTTISLSGNNMTLNLPVTFASGYAGTQTLYMWAGNAGGSNTGWQSRGAWTVPGGSGTPSAVSVSPSSGNGATQTFSLQYSDTAGATKLSAVWMWFTATGAQPNSCMMQFVPSANTLYLINDAVTGWITATPGVAGTLQNSQCAINAGNTTISLSGNNMTLNLPVTFSGTYSGIKTAYLWAGDAGGTNAGWQSRGTWTIP
jgi:hypothetical protein